MKYRAVLDLPGCPVKVEQFLTNNARHLRVWFEEVLIRHPEGKVVIYEVIEREISVINGSERENLCSCGHVREYHRLTTSSSDLKYGACNACYCKRFTTF